jgi:hypothetical protein
VVFTLAFRHPRSLRSSPRAVLATAPFRLWSSSPPSCSSFPASLPFLMAPLPPLVIVDPYAWERSTVTWLALGDLVSAGQLAANEEGRPAEWIVPPAGDHAPNPPSGYVVSFTRFHERGFAAPASRFMRALCHHYGVELHNFAPNAISQAATFVGICEGYLGIPVNWDLWIHLFPRGAVHAAGDGAEDPPRGARRWHVARLAGVVQGRLHPLYHDDQQRRLGAGVVLPSQRRARPPPLHRPGAPREARLLEPRRVPAFASEAVGLAPGRAAEPGGARADHGDRPRLPPPPAGRPPDGEAAPHLR